MNERHLRFRSYLCREDKAYSTREEDEETKLYKGLQVNKAAGHMQIVPLLSSEKIQQKKKLDSYDEIATTSDGCSPHYEVLPLFPNRK
ncbi:hypothetical protein D0Y65_032174 [Glycine soja]|uniref:Uncharacterized protein n=1 Tax=Glycine soja TaxID=3848 RepID=A0A445ICD2_GLYSO|nr:hypothetical protein D0Y65_032174 [Glycine soja]